MGIYFSSPCSAAAVATVYVTGRRASGGSTVSLPQGPEPAIYEACRRERKYTGSDRGVILRDSEAARSEGECETDGVRTQTDRRTGEEKMGSSVT